MSPRYSQVTLVSEGADVRTVDFVKNSGCVDNQFSYTWCCAARAPLLIACFKVNIARTVHL